MASLFAGKHLSSSSRRPQESAKGLKGFPTEQGRRLSETNNEQQVVWLSKISIELNVAIIHVREICKTNPLPFSLSGEAEEFPFDMEIFAPETGQSVCLCVGAIIWPTATGLWLLLLLLLHNKPMEQLWLWRQSFDTGQRFAPLELGIEIALSLSLQRDSQQKEVVRSFAASEGPIKGRGCVSFVRGA